MDAADLVARRRELQRVKRKAQRDAADADREIGEIDKQLRRAPNASR